MNIDRVVVLKVRSLGDTLLATPALRALRDGFPQARITVVVSPVGQEVLEGNPDIDTIFIYDKTRKGWAYQWEFIRQLARQRFNLAIALHASFRTALFARLSGAHQRIVHNHSGRNFFSTLPITAKKESKSAIERDLDAIHALGLPSAGERLILNVEPAHQQTAKSFLVQHKLTWQPFLILNAGAGREGKRINPAAAAAFLNIVSEQLPARWVLLAGPDNLEWAESIQALAPVHPPIFQRSLKEAAALISQSQGLVTTDSGLKHVAVAMGTPTLTLWADEPEVEWHPYDLSQHALLRSETGQVEDISPSEIASATAEHFGRFMPR